MLEYNDDPESLFDVHDDYFDPEPDDEGHDSTYEASSLWFITRIPIFSKRTKFVRPNSVRVELTVDRDNSRNDLDGVAFITPEYQHVVVLQNRNMSATYQVSIQDAGLAGKELRLDIEPRSLVTLVWN
uniref:Glycosyl hydrolase family 30 beta sandwich domain-containing protein n=1 Tax=Acrobeloides nanus TaxID=290746 RepID=A0A914BWN7_9BILA